MMRGLAIPIAFAIIAVLMAAEGRAQPNKTTVAAFQAYLPPRSLDRLLPALERAVARHGQAASSPFTSVESSMGAPEPVMNQVSLTTDGTVDVWLMRQRQARREGSDPQQWSLVGILVDRGLKPQQAYFLEFAPEPVASGALPLPIAPRVQCYRCHANGPRLIRPEVGRQPLAIDEAQRLLLGKWNDRIRDSGVVSMYVPTAATEADQLRDSSRVANEPVPFAFCTDCHGGKAAVRGVLRRQHLGSIEFLLAHRETEPKGGLAMPIDDTLSAIERSCLQAWLRAAPLAPECTGMMARSVAPTPVRAAQQPAAREKTPEGSWLAIDTEHSALTVNVSTNVSQFSLTDLRLAGTLSGPDCSSTITVGLDAVRTGLRVRDRHLQEQILEGYETAHLKVEPASCPELREAIDHGGDAKVAVTLAWRGSTKLLFMSVSFRDGVALFEVPLTLTDFGVTPPAVFGLRVAAVVTVVGRIQLQAPAARL